MSRTLDGLALQLLRQYLIGVEPSLQLQTISLVYSRFFLPLPRLHRTPHLGVGCFWSVVPFPSLWCTKADHIDSLWLIITVTTSQTSFKIVYSLVDLSEAGILEARLQSSQSLLYLS